MGVTVEMCVDMLQPHLCKELYFRLWDSKLRGYTAHTSQVLKTYFCTRNPGTKPVTEAFQEPDALFSDFVGLAELEMRSAVLLWSPASSINVPGLTPA